MKIIHLFEGYKEAEADFSQLVDPNIVKQTIADYKNLVNKNQLQGQERNIDFWRKQGWEQFSQKVNSLLTRPTKSQVKKKQVVGNSIFIEESPQWLIVVPLDKSASCFHGKGTEWCTAIPSVDYFETYFYNNKVLLIYCLKKATGEKFAIAAHKDTTELEMFSADDTPLTKEQFFQLTGLDPAAIRDKAFSVAGVSADESRAEHKRNSDKLYNIFYVDKRFSPRNQDIEDLLKITRSQKFSKLYIERNGKSDYPPELILTAIKPDYSESHDAIYFTYQLNPTPALIKSAVRINPAVAKWVDNLDSTLQSQLVNQNPENIQYINNPSLDIQMEVVSVDPQLVEFIKNLYPQVAMQAIIADSSVIKLMHNPREELQLAAVENDGTLIQYIENPTPKVLIAAAVENPNVMKYIKRAHDLSPGMIKQMVEQRPKIIQYIDNPSTELQMLAIRERPRTIFDLIENPTLGAEQIDLDVWAEAVHLLEFIDMEEAMWKIPLEYAWEIFGNEWKKAMEKDRFRSLYLSSEDTELIDLARIFLRKLKSGVNPNSPPVHPDVLKGADMVRDFLKKIS